MCLIAFALQARPDCPLLLAANRDEHWQRPTLPLQTWQLPDGVTVHSGRDLQAGGTWLGFSGHGRVAMLTNVRSGPPDAAPRSRGELVTRWLAGDGDLDRWLEPVAPADYGGFNIVLGDLQRASWTWLSNQPGPVGTASPATRNALPLPPGWAGCRLGAGVYGLSNAGLDTPWPKTLALKGTLASVLPHWGQPNAHDSARAQLLQTLMDMRHAPAHACPDTGVPPEMERHLSSAFVHMPDRAYGTRSSLLAGWRNGQLDLEEWTHPVDGTGPDGDGPLTHWPIGRSAYRRISISMCGMPTSS